jgi:quinol-cytochrome oxidoreductase complex cytochrome b subunit
MNALFNWLDHRTGYRALVHEALYEPIPGGARWRYVWGSTLVFTFFVQVVTGLLLWTAYAPSAQTAWESVYYIQHEMTLGWLVRGIHHFAAQAMVVLLALHFMQIVVDGAYKAPREVNFWLGVVLMLIVLGMSLTGYLLPWDQKGYYATKVATNMMGVTPGVGPETQALVQGGPEYGHHTLTRFFALHAGILPALLVAFLGLHIYVFRRHAITPALPHKNPKFAVVLTLLFGPVGMFYSNVVAAVVMAPLSELFFRAFATVPLSRRYSPLFGVLISSTLYALVLGMPVGLLLGIGLALGEVFRRTQSGLSVILAQFVLHLGLVVTLAYSSWARALICQ